LQTVGPTDDAFQLKRSPTAACIEILAAPKDQCQEYKSLF
jgi:hypothetical protein